MSVTRSIPATVATISKAVGTTPPMMAGTRCILLGRCLSFRLNTQQCRGKRTASVRKTAAKKKASRIRRKANSGGGGGPSLAEGQYLYGLRPVDYSVPPPIYRAPPPPPPRPGMRKFVFPATLAVMFGTTAYFYVNNKNDAYEYWEAMQTGSIPLFDEDDDDDDLDEEED